MDRIVQGSVGKQFGIGESRNEVPERQFINYYRCSEEGEEWASVWSCCCNDMCPKCGTKDIEPYKSEEVVHTNRAKRKPEIH